MLRHAKEAKAALASDDNSEFISVTLENDPLNFQPRIAFSMQSRPAGDCGVTGCQASDIIAYTIELFKSLDREHRCIENERTILSLERALVWQERRTLDRERRGVEGTHKE